MKDKLTIKAKREGLRARSAYKLIEINKKYRIIKKGYSVLDLGCWPGGWLIIAKKASSGYVLGLDLKEIYPIKDCDFLMGDVFSEGIIDLIKSRKDSFNVVLSDMAPRTTGIKELDKERSKDLCFRALEIAETVLEKNGSFLCKIFQSEEQKKLINLVRKKFDYVRVVKPQSSKKRSYEVYVLGLRFKG